MTNVTIHHGDVLEVLRTFESESFDALLSDPPSGTGFMGKEWDKDKGGRKQWIKWLTKIMRQAFRVLKPGSHILVWALPRTSHWTATAIEDAGFEIRDVCTHLFASGFPKSHDVSKAIDAAAGAEREVVGVKSAKQYLSPRTNSPNPMDRERGVDGGHGADSRAAQITAPVTDDAKRFAGYGSALKPASENWILARKPLDGTIAANAIKHGTGGLAIDACRISHANANDLASHEASVAAIKARGGSMANSWKNSSDLAGANDVSTLGRWPANLMLSHFRQEWLSIREDVPSGVIDAIHSYYGVDETVQSLRRVDCGDAVGTRPSKILQQGVRWSFSQGSSQDRVDIDRVQVLRGSLRGDEGLGSERSSEILFARVPREGKRRQQAPRQASFGQIKESDGGCKDREILARELVTVEGGSVYRPRGLRSCDDRNIVGAGLFARDADGNEEQVHSGASRGGSGKDRASAPSVGDRSPRERREGSERIGQLICGESQGSLDQTSCAGERVVSFEGDSSETADRAGRLEVSSDLIPNGWIEYFELSHEEGCIRVGERRLAGDLRGECNGQRPSGFASVGAASGDSEPNARVYGDEVVEAWLCAPGCPVKLLDEQSGDRPGMSGGGVHRADYAGGMFGGIDSAMTARGDSGGASRFFFVAKPSRFERELGCEGLPLKSPGEVTGREDGSDGLNSPRAGAGRTGGARNHHPTLKAVALTTELAKLIKPPGGGRILCPFAGSGSEVIGAMRAGWDEIHGIELEEEFVTIARARIARWSEIPSHLSVDEIVDAAERGGDKRQETLFK